MKIAELHVYQIDIRFTRGPLRRESARRREPVIYQKGKSHQRLEGTNTSTTRRRNRAICQNVRSGLPLRKVGVIVDAVG